MQYRCNKSFRSTVTGRGYSIYCTISAVEYRTLTPTEQINFTKIEEEEEQKSSYPKYPTQQDVFQNPVDFGGFGSSQDWNSHSSSSDYSNDNSSSNTDYSGSGGDTGGGGSSSDW